MRRWMTPDRVPLLGSPGTSSFAVFGSVAYLVGSGEAFPGLEPGGTIWFLQRMGDGSWRITQSILTGGSLDNQFRILLLVLVPVCLGASFHAIVAYRKPWRLLGAVPAVALAVYVALILVPAWFRGLFSGMFPFELAMALWPTVPYMVVLLAVRWVMVREPRAVEPHGEPLGA